MLETLSIDRFAPTLNQEWLVRSGPQVQLACTLISAAPLGAPPADGSGLSRQAFSLVWRGPGQPILPQAIYELTHPSFDQPLELFLVPLGPDGSAPGMRYEAIFT
ncbi:MAG TPA: hypothetical protein VD886_21010 [Herpetosiphonaceae bacterium]|nr:hypothetical protein [Herpetosiphonaceae bacterium]